VTLIRNLHQTSISSQKHKGIDIPYLDIFVFVACILLNEIFMSKRLRRVIWRMLLVEPLRAKPIRKRVNDMTAEVSTKEIRSNMTKSV